MKPSSKFLILALLAIILIPSVMAINTGAASLVGSNNATINCIATSGKWWVEWGQTTGLYWKSSNQSATATAYRIHESPLFGNSYFYYRCCDSTGCGDTLNFTTAQVTPLIPTGIGSVYENITESGFDIPSIAGHIIDPYLWVPNMPLTIVFMLMFSPLFIGIWLRSRTVIVALIFGFIVGSFILFSNSTTGISMPPELVSLAQAICYVAFAGAILYIVHR